MSCRSISLVICMFLAVSLATLHGDPYSTKEWSAVDSVREVGQESAGHLGELLDAGDYAVVTVEAGDTRLAAHRAVLAAGSHVLADMLSQSSEEDNGSWLVVPGVGGAVLRPLLAFLYTMRVPRLSPGTAHQLLAAAHRLGMPALWAECERQLAAQLTVETAAAAAVLAVEHSAKHLMDAAVDFIKDHRIKVLATKGWADALENRPREAAKVSHLLADRLAEICGPTTVEAEYTTTAAEVNISTEASPVTITATAAAEVNVSTQASPASVTAAAVLPTCPSSLLDVYAIYRLRKLSGEERDRRLLQAAKEGAVGYLRELLFAEADVGAREGPWYTPLHFAAMKGHLEVASCLLRAGADVDSKGRWEWTPLHEAAFWDHAAMVRLLLAASADPNARDQYGSTPLHVAAYFGKPEAAAALLEGGADREAENDTGRTPLDDAVAQNQRQLIDILSRS